MTWEHLLLACLKTWSNMLSIEAGTSVCQCIWVIMTKLAMQLNQTLPGCQLIALQTLSFVQFKQYTMQDAFAIRASRIDAHGLSDLDRASRLMDMTMQRKQGLVFLDHSAHSFRSGRSHEDRASLNNGA